MALAALVVVPLALAADGALDPSFDGDGKVTTSFATYAWAEAVAVQPDGRIVAAGTAGNDFALARYLPDGSLDASLDSDGRVTVDLGALDAAVTVAVQHDGKIVVGGYTAAAFAQDRNFALARLTSSGALDPSFDGDGLLVTDLGADDSAWQVLLQPDGKLVVAGFTWGASRDMAVVRYTPAGALDPAFDGDGVAIVDFAYIDAAFDVVRQPDGKIVVAGYSYDNTTFATRFAAARLDAAGALDPTFDGDGRVTTAITAYDSANSVELQPDGRILVGGYGLGTAGADYGVVRYLPDGSLDPSFDGDGKVQVDMGAHDLGTGLALQSDGKIVVSGLTFVVTPPTAGPADFGLARLTPAGALDASFDGDGRVTTDFGGNDAAYDVAVQADGKIVAAGAADGEFALARYLSTALVGPPTSKGECKDGGWQGFNNPAFKNQGDCVSYVATGGRNRSG